jgi:hypothetical protein
MAQTIYAPIQTGSLSEIAAAPFRERERQVMSRIANADKATQQTGIYDVSTAGLAPNMQAVAQPWVESIKKNMTEGFYSNDNQKVNEARRQAQELKAFVESGKLATKAADDSVLYGEKNLWRGLSVDKQTGKQLYSDFTQKPFNVQYDANGYPLIVKDDGSADSPLAVSNLNPQNYLIFTESIDWGKNIDPKAYVNNYNDLIVNAKTEKEAAAIITKQYNEDKKLGRVKPDDIGVSYLLNKDYLGIRPEDVGQSRIIEEKDIVIGDDELFAEADSYYLNNAIEAGMSNWRSAQAAAAKRDKPTTEKAPKFEQRTTTIDLGDGNFSKATQYTLTSPLKVGAKTFYNVYQTPAGEWYGFSATNKRRGSKSFVEEELIKLDSLESDYVVGQLGLKGAAGTTNRATRAASRM